MDDVMKPVRMIKNSFKGWLPKESGITCSHKLSKSHWKRPVWMVAILLVIILAFSTSFVLFSSVMYGEFIRYINSPNEITSFSFRGTSNMTTPKVGDVFEITINVTWFCPPTLEFEQKIVTLIDPYHENNCRLIGGNNTVQCSAYEREAQITYLLEVIDDNLETFMMPYPFTAAYVDGVELQFGPKR
jgi:hypothetical protein